MYRPPSSSQVPLLGASVKRRPYMIVTELMTGGSVWDTLKGGGQFSMWRTLMLALDFARGMDHLHRSALDALNPKP